jgi:hypothetical protein
MHAVPMLKLKLKRVGSARCHGADMHLHACSCTGGCMHTDIMLWCCMCRTLSANKVVRYSSYSCPRVSLQMLYSCTVDYLALRPLHGLEPTCPAALLSRLEVQLVAPLHQHCANCMAVHPPVLLLCFSCRCSWSAAGGAAGPALQRHS